MPGVRCKARSSSISTARSGELCAAGGGRNSPGVVSSQGCHVEARGRIGLVPLQRPGPCGTLSVQA